MSDDDKLTKAERARIRRRDRDAAAEDRELMNDGSAKWFKQVLDHRSKITPNRSAASRIRNTAPASSRCSATSGA